MNRPLWMAIVYAALFFGGEQLSLAVPSPLENDVPPHFTPAPRQTDYELREPMIAMRDGVKLHTILVMPKGAHRAPLILMRTPYSASGYVHADRSNHLTSVLPAEFAELAEAGYILAIQDVRGKFGSEGEYAVLRPLSGKWNPTGIDEATDAYDSIDWLVKQTPESNGKVATMGTSYMGFTTLMSLIHPHPALKAAVAINPYVDGWMGDDWFHHGAFREMYLDWIYSQTSGSHSEKSWVFDRYDVYETWLEAGTPQRAAAAVGMDALPAWQRFMRHPAYDEYWQDQALDRILAAQPLAVPTLHVHSQWDQEDLYGSPAAYAALEPKDLKNEANYLVIGPWDHTGSGGDGATLGALRFGCDTGSWYRRHVLRPFLDAHLKDGGSSEALAPVTVFETGTNLWRRYERWPQSCAAGCPYVSQSIYLTANQGLRFDRATDAGGVYDEYLSDPAKPVTNRLRPLTLSNQSWSGWLVDDQRFASDRPDVLTYTSEVLKQPLQLAGQPIAHFFASTSGSDSDWVVKLIDVYPDELASQLELSGYQLPLAMDILRGRYRDDPAHPKPIPAGQVVAYELKLPPVSHTILPGHRLMVQIQSAWFPLYDRNPQVYVRNIFDAGPSDFHKATQRVYHSRQYPSRIELPIMGFLKQAARK